MSLRKICPKCRRECGNEFYNLNEGHCFDCSVAWHKCLGGQLVVQDLFGRTHYGADGYTCPNCKGNPNREFPGPLSRYLSECPNCGGRPHSRCNCSLRDLSCSKCPAVWHVCQKYGKLVMAPHAPHRAEYSHIKCECARNFVY